MIQRKTWIRFAIAIIVLVVVGLAARFMAQPTDARSTQAPGTSDVQVSNTGATGPCAAAPPTVTPVESFKYTVTVDPRTAWRPVGGELIVQLKGQNNTPVSGLTIQTCFTKAAWGRNPPFVAGGPITVDSSNGQLVVFRTAIPDLDQYEIDRRSWWQKHVVRRWRSLVEDGSIIPISYLRVIATSGPDPAKPAAATPVVDVLLPIGVTSVSSALISTLVIVVGALTILWFFVRNRFGADASFLLLIIASRSGAASLSQFQMVLWTFVVGASAIYVILLSGNLIDISNEVLTLLGITGVTLLGAQLAPDGSTAGGQRRTPKWSDLVADPEGQGIDVSRVQMFFFTIVSALFVVLKVFGNYAIPDLPAGYLTLMGISNGVYLANKFVPKSG